MKQESEKQKNNLPKLEDLHHDVQVAFKNDQLALLLNQSPPENWIKEHPLYKVDVMVDGQKRKVPVKYLPIEKVEYLLTRIFQEWRVEILREGQLFNSVYITIRLHYKNPISGEWCYHDGGGAMGVQTDSGKSAADLAAIKQNAIMMALPAAKSFAIKDAAEHLGKLFGKDLNRSDAVAFTGHYNTMWNQQNIEENGATN